MATTASSNPAPATTATLPDYEKARKFGERMAKQKLNANSPELQERLMEWVAKFQERVTYFHPATGERIDYPRHGLLAEMQSRTPSRIYDLPELKMVCDTAFVDTTGRMYMSDSLFRLLEQEELDGKGSLFFVFRHEMEHLRRLHLQRMMDFPHDLANIAQDIRINCDIVTATVGDDLMMSLGRVPEQKEMDAAVEKFYSDMSDTVHTFCAMKSFSEYKKWFGMSEEAIAAELMKTWNKNPPPQNQPGELSFPALCEGVGQDLDAMTVFATGAGNSTGANEFTQTAGMSRAAGKARGKLTRQQLMDLYTAIDRAMKTQEMTSRNLQHAALAQAAIAQGKPPTSVNTGDKFVDGLVPIERLSALLQVIKMILNPATSGNPSGGGITIKDLDLPRTNPPQNTPGAPNPNIYNGDDHVMSGDKMGEILKKAGADDAAKALGYDDLDKMTQEEKAAKANVSGAINQASEDKARVGARYPGGHMVDYAVAQLNQFHKPLITWKFGAKRLIEGLGNSTRFEQEEPWAQYYTPAADQGLESEADIGYMGSFILGNRSRPLVFVVTDTSGSVTDAQLVRFFSESVNMARETGQNENAPEVIIVPADTIARGVPIFVNQDNFEQTLKSGINYGGRGGTNFTASVQNVFRMVSVAHEADMDGGEQMNRYRGRKIDAIIYMTDTGDAAPEQSVIEETAFECGMNKLPAMLFLAPKECFNDRFNRDVSNYAEVIYFDTNELTVDMEEVEANVAARGARATATM